jgi:hypothetical protein
MSETPANFIGYLFLARDVAHSVHLNTRSFSKHMALNTFYDEIVGLADSLAEVYQGEYGLMGPITLQSAKKTANITQFLENQLKELRECRYEAFDKSDTPLQNIVDEIEALYRSTLYKLKFLA